MEIDSRFVIMLRRHLDSPSYEGQWPIIFIRDQREDAVALCGSAFVRVNRVVAKSRYQARRIEPCSLVDARTGNSYPGGVYRLNPV